MAPRWGAKRFGCVCGAVVATNGCIFGAGPSCTQAARFDYAQRPAEAILLASKEGRGAKTIDFAFLAA